MYIFFDNELLVSFEYLFLYNEKEGNKLIF